MCTADMRDFVSLCVCIQKVCGLDRGDGAVSDSPSFIEGCR